MQPGEGVVAPKKDPPCYGATLSLRSSALLLRESQRAWPGEDSASVSEGSARVSEGQ
jgi:hypothetical protein